MMIATIHSDEFFAFVDGSVVQIVRDVAFI